MSIFGKFGGPFKMGKKGPKDKCHNVGHRKKIFGK